MLSFWFFVLLVIIAIFFFSVAAGFTFLLKILSKNKKLSKNSEVIEAKQWRLLQLQSKKLSVLSIIGTRKTDLKSDLYLVNSFSHSTLDSGQAENAIKNGRFVILIGSHYESSSEIAFLAKKYVEMGINVLATNCRGNNVSSGRLAGFAWRDSRDLVLWIKKLIELYGKDISIYLHGISTGASTVLLLPSIKSKNAFNILGNIKGIISDSAILSFSKQIKIQIEFILGKSLLQKIITEFIIFGISFSNFIVNGFFFFQASPIKSLKTKQSKLFFKNCPTLIYQNMENEYATERQLKSFLAYFKQFENSYVFLGKYKMDNSFYFYRPDEYMVNIKNNILK